MTKLGFILLVLMLSSCATSYALKHPAGCRKSDYPPAQKNCEQSPTLRLEEAVAIDIEIARQITAGLTEQFQREPHTARHIGEDSNICTSTETKICSIQSGCSCK